MDTVKMYTQPVRYNKQLRVVSVLTYVNFRLCTVSGMEPLHNSENACTVI
jgi:hypothetical protein